MSKALRYNEGKCQWSLVHFQSLQSLVKVLEFGAIKYDRHNWKKGLNRDEILDSLTRHLSQVIDGEETDSESKIHHMGHIMANAMFYMYHLNNKSFTESIEKKEELA